MTRQPGFPDEVFRAELEQSYEWLDVVAGALAAAGVRTRQAERRFRADVSKISEFTRFEKDLVLATSGACIEVKSRTESWTSPFDFPL